MAGFCAYGGLYWVGGQTQWEAVFGGVGFFAFGFGLSAWGKYLLPQGPFVEDRHDLKSTEPEIEAMAAAIEDRGKMVFRRRGFLGTILGAGAGVMGVVITFPLLRSLGPPPKKTFDTTNWRSGSHVVDLDGRRIHRADLEVGGSLTVFPEGHRGVRRSTRPCSSGPTPRTSRRCPGATPGAPRDIWPTPRCAPTPAVRSASTRKSPSSCCARVTSRCSTCSPVPTRCSVPLRVRCRSCRSQIDSQGFLMAQAGYDQPVGTRVLGAVMSALDVTVRRSCPGTGTARRTPSPTPSSPGCGGSTSGSGVAKGGRTLLDKIFPDHWSFLLGEIALYSFVVLIATGIFVSLYFIPSAKEIIYHGPYVPLRGSRVSAAFESTVNLSFGVRSGLVIRQMHHWAADVFVGAIAVHMCRIFFTGAFRKPPRAQLDDRRSPCSSWP